MATVKVTFPDGSVRDWPARQHMIPSREIPPREASIKLVPIDDAEWTFSAVVGGWRALRR